MDLPETRILVVVATKLSENLSRRRNKGFSAMVVSGELGDPKATPNWELSKGKTVNIPSL